jgi:hypothetical protein
LSRLLDPLYAVLTHVGICNTDKRRKTVATTLINILIKAMYKHQIAYWGFSTPVWDEILGKDYYDYVQTHGVTANARHQLIAVAYLLCDFTNLNALGKLSYPALASKIFTQNLLESKVDTILSTLKKWGYTETGNIVSVRAALSKVLILQRSPLLKAVTLQSLTEIYHLSEANITRRGLSLISQSLTHLNIISGPIGSDKLAFLKEDIRHREAIRNLSPEWLDICERWFATSTLQNTSRIGYLYRIFQAGRWFAQTYPNLKGPSDWTREICAEYVAAVDRGRVGDWSAPIGGAASFQGKPLAASTKASDLRAMKVFLEDCQEWGWIKRHFSPQHALATPRSVRTMIGINPRVIDDATWAKLVWAGLNLTSEDLLKPIQGRGQDRDNWRHYPPEMIRALAILWLFGGLRRNEIMRLRTGCIRWQEEYLTENSSR